MSNIPLDREVLAAVGNGRRLPQIANALHVLANRSLRTRLAHLVHRGEIVEIEGYYWVTG